MSLSHLINGKVLHALPHRTVVRGAVVFCVSALGTRVESQLGQAHAALGGHSADTSNNVYGVKLSGDSSIPNATAQVALESCELDQLLTSNRLMTFIYLEKKSHRGSA